MRTAYYGIIMQCQRIQQVLFWFANSSSDCKQFVYPLISDFTKVHYYTIGKVRKD